MTLERSDAGDSPMPVTFNIGDRFRRPGGAKPDYRAIRIIEFPRHPPQFKLISENPDRQAPTSGYR